MRVAISLKDTSTIILLMLLAAFILCLGYFTDKTENAFQANTKKQQLLSETNDENTIEFNSEHQAL